MFKNRKNNKKGFTLVEVIVVLVILAILAAIMIPALTGWIEKANKKTALVEARSALLALQTEASENYNNIKVTGDTGTLADDPYVNDAEKLAELADASIGEVTINKMKKVTKFTYTSSTGYTVTYENKAFTVADK